MATAVDWLHGLADETWRDIAGRLGLHALALRATCATLYKHVLALKELPVTIQLARRLVHFLEHEFYREVTNLRTRKLYPAPEESRVLYQALRRANPAEFFGMLHALETSHGKRLKASRRRFPSLISQFCHGSSLTCLFRYRGTRAAKLDRCWNEHVFSDQDLVKVIHCIRRYATTFFVTNFRNPSCNDFTTSWHLAAERGNLEVLKYFRANSVSYPHATSLHGNSALAHARRGLDLRLAALDSDEKKAAVFARFAAVIAFLKACNVPDHEWRSPQATPFDHNLQPDTDSDASVGSDMDIVDVALETQMQA